MSYTIDEYWTDVDGIQRVRDDDTGLYGLIAANGNILTPCRYSMIIHLDDECRLGAIEREGKWGYINTFGQEIVPCKYDTVSDRFYCGRAEVRRNGKSGFIDKYGEIVVQLQYDEVSFFWDDIAPVKKDGKWGLINLYGREIWSFSYDALYIMGAGIIVAGKRKLLGFGSMKYCLFDYNGHQITDYKYDEIGNQVLRNGRILYKKGTERGYLDRQGNEFPTFG